MLLLDLTLPRPEENLACDEVLLDTAESGDGPEVLRFWAPAQFFVVVGYANRAAREVNLAWCQEHGIPVLRRCSGGGTVLQGPGVLNYSLILRASASGPFRTITSANQFIMATHRDALRTLLAREVTQEGHTDLALEGLKFSGNAQRRRQQFLLFHGSFLLDMDLDAIERALPMPSSQPDYRANRRHRDFLTNFPVPMAGVKRSLAKAWNAAGAASAPMAAIARLAASKYSQSAWNLKF